MGRYEAYLQQCSITDTLLDTPPIFDIGPKDKGLEGYEFLKPQFYIRRDGATDPKQDILVGPTFADNRAEDLAALPVAPAAATV